MIVNMSVVIEIVTSFAIITQKEAGDGPYLKKSCLNAFNHVAISILDNKSKRPQIKHSST